MFHLFSFSSSLSRNLYSTTRNRIHFSSPTSTSTSSIRFSSTLRFIDKQIIVTGGANGIGRAIVEAFLHEGGKVAILDRDIATAEKYFTKDTVKPYKYSPTFHPVDVAKETEVQHTIQQIMDKSHGKLHVLVNDAAAFQFGTIDQASSVAWDTVINVNIKGYANTMKYSIPYLRNTVQEMRKANASATPLPSVAIVNVSSMSAFIAQGAFVPYSTTKAAQLHMTRLVALDEAAHGIRVNCVCPGPILTEATEKHAKGVGQPLDKVIHEMTSNLAIKRMGMPSEVAKAVLFFAGEDSSFTTGSHIMVDGGYTIM